MTTYVVDARTASARFPGIGRYTVNLLRALPGQLQAGESIIYLCSRRQKGALALPDQDRLHWIEWNASPFGLRQQWQDRGILRRVRASVYHSPYYLMPYFTGINTILTVYDLIPQFFPGAVSARARLLFRLATRLALRRASHTIAISEATRRDFLKAYGLAPGVISTVPLAAAPHFSPAAAEEVAAMKRTLALPAPYVLYVGTDKPHKNLAALLQAWNMLGQSDRQGHQLVLAGHFAGRRIEALARSASGPPQVRTITNVPEAHLRALYSGASLFVFPSLYEGFGLPVIEAMACGCAVACSNRSSLPEIVGEAGLLFDPQAPAAIAAAISALLSDRALRQKLGALGLERAKGFSWQRTAAETVALYRRFR